MDVDKTASPQKKSIFNLISVIHLGFFLLNLATRNGVWRFFWLQNAHAMREPCGVYGEGKWENLVLLDTFFVPS